MKDSTITEIWAIVSTIISISLLVCGIFNSITLYMAPSCIFMAIKLWNEYLDEKKIEDETFKI